MPALTALDETVNASLNATDTADGSDVIQHATGQTLLWAMTALALTAASQQSVTAKYHRLPGYQVETTAGVYRISPLICLYDAVAELYTICSLLIQVLKRKSSSNTLDEDFQVRTDEAAAAENVAASPQSDEIELLPPMAAPVGPQQAEGRTDHPAGGRARTIAPKNGQDHEVKGSASAIASRVYSRLYNLIIMVVAFCIAGAHLTIDMFTTPLADIGVLHEVSAPPMKQYSIKLYNYMRSQSGEDCPKPPATKAGLCILLTRFTAWLPEGPVFERMSFATYSTRLAVFVLGALPQAIKIFATQNIPFTQAMAGVYFASIVIHGIARSLGDLLGVQPVAPVRTSYIRHGVLLYIKGTHHWLYFWWWQQMSWKQRLPQDPNTVAICDAILWWNTPISIAWLIIYAAIMCSLPFSRRVRHYLQWAHWVYAWRSFEYCLFNIVQHQKPRSVRYAAEASMPLIQQILLSPNGDNAVALLSVPALVCIGLAQLARWSFRGISSEEDSDAVLRGNDPNYVINLLQDLRADAMQELREKEGLRSEGSSSWRKHIRTGFVVVFCTFAMPLQFGCKAHYWYSKLHPDVQWSAFLLFNILTFTVYYTLCFDGSNSVQPDWLTVFGRRL